MPDTSPSFATSNYFPYLVSDVNRELKISIDLGYFYIPPVAESAQSSISDTVNNPFFPNPGGKQQESLMNQNLKKYKSQTLSKVSNGVMPQHIEITGAPYCTYLEGTISNQPHPYYDLLQGPEAIIQSPNSAIFNTVQPVQQIYQNKIKNSNIAQSVQQINAVGSVYIPGTSQTNAEIQSLKQASKLKTSTTYNIWSIDNLPYNNGINSNFIFTDYLGWFPKSGTQIQNLQPYAQVLPLADTSMIQVYSSNSQISLTRKFPFSKDFVFDKNARFTVFNSGTNDKNNNFQVNPLGFNENKIPVGFVLKFNAVVSNTIPVPSGIGSSALLTEPRMIISWGDLNVTTSQLESLVNTNSDNSNVPISLYSLEISPNRSPKLYINYLASTVLNQNPDANSRVIELSNIKPLNSPNKNSGAKTDNDYSLYVFYSGQYLKIGNQSDPGSWSDVKAPSITVADDQPPINFDHSLNEKSSINIVAQFMNFSFAFGQPLFSPYDPVNTVYNADPTKQTTNTLNQISSNNVVYVGDRYKYPDINTYVAVKKNEILKSITQNSSRTFQENSNGNIFGPPTCYFDARCGFSQTSPTYNGFLLDVIPQGLIPETTQPGGLAYNVTTKMTYPATLGGHVYNFHSDGQPDEPNISESYVKYFKNFPEGIDTSEYTVPPTVSQVLTDSLVSLTINKDTGNKNGSGVLLKSIAEISLINLNRNNLGKYILHFIRNNVAVIRVRAGYGDGFETNQAFFEGAITKVLAKESLEQTTFSLTCEDLISHLFENDKTLIVSRQRLSFFGQKYYDIINYLCDKTELKNHFQYDLGSEIDPTNSGVPTLYGQLKNDGVKPYKPLFRLPALSGNFQKPGLNKMSVGAYVSDSNTSDGNNTTYLGVLKTIASMMVTDLTQFIQSSNGQQTDNSIDQPIMYWYSNTYLDQDVDGIVFSSRNGKDIYGFEKDEDSIFIRKSSLTKDATPDQYDITQIEYLHGLMVNSESVYASEADTNNLISIGLYRGFDNAGNSFAILEQLPNALNYPPDLKNSVSYIGYNRILIFDDPKSANAGQTALPANLMGNQNQARTFVKNVLNAFYDTILENVTATVFVTKPLKEWGHFKIYFENEQNPINTDKFFYTSINYTFDIKKNLITASINGGKKPLYT